MPQDNRIKIIHMIYGIIVSVLIVALGVAMIISCWDIYSNGPNAFTRQSIGEKLKDMSILLWLNLGAIVSGVVLNIFMPLHRPKTKAIRDELVTMRKLAAKAGTPTPEEKSAIEKLQRKRWLFPVITGGIFGGLISRPVFYLLDKANFPSTAPGADPSTANPTPEIIDACFVALPPAIIGLVLCYICSIIVKKLILKETDIYKQIIASGSKVVPAPPVDTAKPTLLKTIRLIGLTVAVAFIILGCFNGSARDVLTKAIKICTECIGLG